MLFTIFTWRKKDKLLTLIFISVLIKSAFVLYFSAQYRFFIEVFFVVFFIVFYQFFSKKLSLLIYSILGFLVMNILFFPQVLQKSVPSFNLGSVMQGFRWEQFNKPSYYALNEYDSFRIGNLEFNVPINYPFGFDIDLPVLVISQLEEFHRLKIFPQLKGKTPKDGFVWRTLTEQEAKELQQIIEKVKTKID